MLGAGENGEFGFGVMVANFSCKGMLGPAVNSGDEVTRERKRERKKKLG